MPESAQLVLRVARTKEKCSVLGPGVRAVIWFHGCSLNCPGCIAHEMNISKSYTPYSPDELVAWVRSIDGIEGITLSGGDPFDQPKLAILEFLKIVKRETTLGVMCYTGRTLGDLLSREDNQINREILGLIDILVDGPYEQLKNEGHQWRGSSNQVIHFLTNRYAHHQTEVVKSKRREIEIDLNLENRLAISGIPEVGFLKRLRTQLESRGVEFQLEAD